MRNLIAVLAVAAFVAGPASAHTYSESGNITTVYPDQADSGLFALLESTAPGTHPNGLFYYTVAGVEGGDTFTVTADDGQEVFVIGTDDQCPPADAGSDDIQDTQDSNGDGIPEPNPGLTDLDWWLNDWNALCNNHPDFDLKFTNGAYTNGPGDEGGTVPASGEAVITLFFGDVGEGFTYSEAA